jgi:hypothetical protein
MDKQQWLTLNAAAKLEECPVTGETLRRMIKAGRVPDGYWMQVPYGETRVTYYIDQRIIAELDYLPQGGQSKGKDN